MTRMSFAQCRGLRAFLLCAVVLPAFANDYTDKKIRAAHTVSVYEKAVCHLDMNREAKTCAHINLLKLKHAVLKADSTPRPLYVDDNEDLLLKFEYHEYGSGDGFVQLTVYDPDTQEVLWHEVRSAIDLNKDVSRLFDHFLKVWREP